MVSQIDERTKSILTIEMKVNSIEEKIGGIDTRVTELETSTQFMSIQFDTAEKERKEVRDKVTKLEREADKKLSDYKKDVDSCFDYVEYVENECIRLKGLVLDCQARSMKNNLIFSGIQESELENCEDKVKKFIKEQMKIQNEMHIDVAHRIGKYVRWDKPRPIVARFHYPKERDMVRSATRELKGTHYGVNEQFPPEVQQKRKTLYPHMKEARRKNQKAYLKFDKLFINDKLVDLDTHDAEYYYINITSDRNGTERTSPPSAVKPPNKKQRYTSNSSDAADKRPRE